MEQLRSTRAEINLDNLKHNIGEAHAGARTRVDEQPLAPLGGAELEDDLVPLGLHDFFNSAAEGYGADLVHHAGEHTGVEGHCIVSFQRGFSLGIL